MRRRTTTIALSLGAALVGGLIVSSGPADAAPGKSVEAIQTVAAGLTSPVSISFGAHNKLFVAEAVAGKIVTVNLDNHHRATYADGLPGIAGLSVGRRGVYITQGYVPETQSAPATAPVSVVKPHAKPVLIGNLLRYELEHNPDGQLQSTGPDADALTNPYAVLAQRNRVLVADAAGNDVLSIAPNGRITTFFAPRNINTGACAGAPNNDPQHPGCDPVPTGVAAGPNGDIYVSGLGAEAPNAARVWQLDGKTGAVKKVWGDLTDATGIAVGSDGSIYVSELFFGQDPNSPTADPSKAGRIVRIAPNGSRTYAPVRLPGGLTFHKGALYATFFSIADEFFGTTGTGSVVKVNPSAFVPGDKG